MPRKRGFFLVDNKSPFRYTNYRKVIHMFKKFLAILVLCYGSSVMAQELDPFGYQKLNKEVSFKLKKLDEPGPTVILIHGGGGVRGFHHLDVWSYVLTSWGYNAVIIDLFSGRGLGDLTRNGQRLSFRTRAKDVIELANYINTQPWHKGGIGAIGFSQGGSTIFALGRDTSQHLIKAGIAYYPACAYETPAFTPSMPTQMHLAMKDDLSIPSLCGINFSLKKHDVHRYENASHVFDIAAEKRVSFGGNVVWYDREAHLLSNERTKAFLDKHLNQ